MAEEGLRKTDNELIHIGSPIPFDEDLFLRQMESLMEAAYNNQDDIRSVVASMVPTYHPAGEHGNATKDATYKQLAHESEASHV